MCLEEIKVGDKPGVVHLWIVFKATRMDTIPEVTEGSPSTSPGALLTWKVDRIKERTLTRQLETKTVMWTKSQVNKVTNVSNVADFEEDVIQKFTISCVMWESG